MTCKNCGKTNRDDATVCKYCGSDLTEEARPHPKASRADAQSEAIQFLLKLALILAGISLAALILALAGLLRGCSAAKTAADAKTAAEAAQTAADEAKAAANQANASLQTANARIQELEDAATAVPVTPVTPDTNTPDTTNTDRYPATDPTVSLTATLDASGKLTTFTYTDANGAEVALEAGAAGLPVSYVLNDANDDVAYESDIDLCAACTVAVPDGYTGEISYRWEGLTGDSWEPRPDKTESCLTVSPGFWFSTRAQYRCQVTVTIRDGQGNETDSISVLTSAVTYTDWENYAEAHADEHPGFLAWSDMMKTYQ